MPTRRVFCQFTRLIARQVDLNQKATDRRKAGQAKKDLVTTEQALQQAALKLETTVRNLLQTGRFSLAEVADLTGNTPEQLRQWQQA